ncbi:MAG: helix-turn-helix transcriptional regulator [Dehalococcoidia bacterium]|nr:helix-turn-helix transcriptional regulator [Dehalococcoidia bacterium]
MEQLRATIRERLSDLNLSARQASIRAGLSHNTLRVILAGARPTAETCDALEPVLGLPAGALRLLAGWPMEEKRVDPDIEYAINLLRLARPEHRQAVIGYLLVNLTPPAKVSAPGRRASRAPRARSASA